MYQSIMIEMKNVTTVTGLSIQLICWFGETYILVALAQLLMLEWFEIENGDTLITSSATFVSTFPLLQRLSNQYKKNETINNKAFIYIEKGNFD